MTIPELLEVRANELGDQTLLICDDVEYSFAEVHARASRVAANLAKRGIGPDSKIALLMGNCMEFVYLFLGAGRIGAIIVPVNPMLKPDEIAYIIGNAEADTLVTIPQFAPFLPLAKQALRSLKHFFIVEGVAGQTGEGEPFDVLLEPVESIPPIAADPQSVASLIYTSGTTGAPKGVMLTHGNYIWNARMVCQAAGLWNLRFLCVLPLFHVNAQVASILTPLNGAGSTVLMKRFNPYDILPMIEKYRCNMMSSVPTIYSMMCRMADAGKYDLSSLKGLATGAAPLPEETFKEVQRVFNIALFTGYGLTEATCASAVATIRFPVKWDSTGFVLPHTNMRIVDENDCDVPYGEIGQILVAGPNVMKGYYKNPEATAEVLKNGWLYTGDLGRFDEEGYLYIVGRIKDMIIRGGQNVYPAEIESALSDLAGLDACCVVGVDSTEWGQEIVAVVKTKQGESLTEEDVLSHCRERLAAYKCPRLVRFVEDFPRTPTGKIKKQEVVAQLFA